MGINLDKLTIVDNTIDHRFECVVNDSVAFIHYLKMGDTIFYTHTEVPSALEGKGIAGKMAQHALNYARENKLKVVPSCPYMRGYIQRHPEYQDLVGE